MKVFGNSNGKKRENRAYSREAGGYYDEEFYGRSDRDYVTRDGYGQSQQRTSSQARPAYGGSQGQQRANPQAYTQQPQHRASSQGYAQPQQRTSSQRQGYPAGYPSQGAARPSQSAPRQQAYASQSGRPSQSASRQQAYASQGRAPQSAQGQRRTPAMEDTRAYRPSGQKSGGHIPPYSRAAAKYAGYDGYEPYRTEADKRRIEAMIAAYQKKKAIRRVIIAVVLVALVVTGILLWRSWVKPPDVVEPPVNPVDSTKPPKTSGDPEASQAPGSLYRKDGVYTFLVVGNDDGNGNTDTMLVGAFDTVNEKLNIVSIPRDTLVNVSWNVKKVNTVMAYTDMDGLKEELSRLMGFQVDSYGVIDLKAFVALVDAVDGVDFDVPVDMHYHDPVQNLYIDINAGYQHLTGEQAVKVVRFRSGYASADIGRIETQQKFLKALAAKCLSLDNLVKNAATYAEIFKTYVDTDLTLGNLIWYLQQFAKLDSEDISFFRMPGNTVDSVKGVSYVTIYPDEWVEMINTYLNPLKEDIQVGHLGILTRNSSGDLYVTDGSEMYTNFASAPGWGSSSEPSPEPSTEPSPEPSEEPSPEPSEEPSPSVSPGDPPIVDPNPSTGTENPDVSTDVGDSGSEPGGNEAA